MASLLSIVNCPLSLNGVFRPMLRLALTTEDNPYDPSMSSKSGLTLMLLKVTTPVPTWHGSLPLALTSPKPIKSKQRMKRFKRFSNST